MVYPKYIEDMMNLSYDMWQQGWDEYNGGNISYILSESEIGELPNLLAETDFRRPDNEIITDENLTAIPENMQGKYLLITASGSHFRNLKEQAAIDIGIVKLTETGYEVVGGFVTGKRPTSEIFMHVLSHSARIEQSPEHCVVVHNHATNVVLYSLLNEVTSKSLTLDLWRVLTESIVVFPDGISVLPWDVPGTREIGEKTAELLKDSRIVVWAKHGVLSTGTSYQDCFGLIETANKAAGLALDLQKISGKSIDENNVLSNEDLQLVCDALHVEGRYL